MVSTILSLISNLKKRFSFVIYIFRKIYNSPKNNPEEISGYFLNKDTGVQEIKVPKSNEIRPVHDMSHCH